ncbi:MAG: DegT/DnrJ/EryC1/StrS family aminotransferase [Myxococcaceae bacterium]
MTIPFLSLTAATAELRAELDEAIGRVVSSGHYIGGPEVEAFEQEFAQFVGARHCIGVGNGLDAITLSLIAAELPRGSKVLVPSNTFIATWLGASHAGLVPVPVEPDWRTHVVTAEAFAAASTRDVSAWLPVHLYGLPFDSVAMRAAARDARVLLVEDAAQVHGATVGGTRVGGHGSTATWSFYPGKNLGALGDAGAVTTNDDALAEALRLLRNYGSAIKYEHLRIGFNSRLDPLQAAALRVRLRHLERWNARRDAVARLYLRELAGVGDLRLPHTPEGRTHAWHLFVVRTAQRDALRAHLDAAGITSLIHYPTPPHQQRAYLGQVAPAGLEETERCAREVLSLPIGPHLSLDDAGQVVAAVRAFFTARR